MSLQPWCDPLFKTQSVTHWFLQHLLVRPIVFYSTSNSIKTRLIKWKQGPGIQSWISKLCFLISGNYEMEAASGEVYLYHKMTPPRGGRQTKDCSQTWSFGFQFRLGKHFSDEHGLAFYYMKIGFLEYLQISGEIRYPNAPIGYWKKETIWKEACIYPRLSGRGSELINKVLMMERLPRRFNIVEHR